MESENVDAQRRRKVFFVIGGAGLFLSVSFSVVNYIGTNVSTMWANIVLTSIVAGAVLALLLGIEDRRVYRFACWGTAIALCFTAAIGSSLLYYHLVLPLLMFFFLGRREGIVGAGVFLFGMTVLMLAPWLVSSHVYQTGNTLRFLGGYLFVTLVGLSYEKSREQFYVFMEAKNEQIQREKEQLQDSLSRIRETEACLEQTLTEMQGQSQLVETVFNSMNEGIVVVDATGRQLFHNPSTKRISGMEMVPSKPSEWAQIYGIFYPDQETHVPTDQNPLVRALRGEETDNFEAFVRNEERPDGVYISGSGRPIRSRETNEVTAAVLVFRDITRLKETEAELRQTIRNLQDQAQLMETVFNSMHECILVVDATGRQLFRNPSAVRISGKGMVPSQPDEWAKIYGIFYPDKETYVPTDQNPLVRALRGESTEDFEAFIRNEMRPDGVHVISEGRTIRDTETNEVKAAVLVFRDVTKLKETEAELRRTIGNLQDQTRLMETVFNSISDGVVVTDTDGGFLLVNPSAERIVGMAETDASSDQWSETYGTFYPDGKTLFPSSDLPLMRAMCGEASDGTELLIRNTERPEGVYISVNARPLRDDADVVKGGVIIFRDITKLKKAETELKQTVRNLQNQTRLMETVFNSISDGVVATDENGSYLIFNASAKRIAGMYEPAAKLAQRPETYGLFLLDRETPFPADELPIARAIRGEATDGVEMFIRNPKRPEGVCIPVSAGGRCGMIQARRKAA